MSSVPVWSPAVIVTIAGLLIFAFAEKAKPARIGEIMFFVGLLALLLGAPTYFK